MKVFYTLMVSAVLVVLSFAELLAGPKIVDSARRTSGVVAGGGPRHETRRYWKPAFPVAPRGPFYYRRYYTPPYAYYGHNPRSIIIVTPSTYYPYYAPVTVVTSEPFYCHVHQVGFVSRVGFLDHISGTHKVPLETANAICADGTESCIIEGY